MSKTMIAKDFALDEFACHCKCNRVVVQPDLPVALQELRDLLGSPIVITSGFRCAKHNRAIGGAKFSAHLGGFAADCTFPGKTLLDAYLEIVRCLPWAESGGIGIYVDRNFIHLDVRKKRKRWGQLGGEYISFDKALLELKGIENG